MYDTILEEYLNTLEHDPDRHCDSEDYSEREIASGEIEAFFDWVERKGLSIQYTKR